MNHACLCEEYGPFRRFLMDTHALSLVSTYQIYILIMLSCFVRLEVCCLHHCNNNGSLYAYNGQLVK